MSIREDRHFVVVDPRNMDGDCYQVAERAIQQVSDLLEITSDNLEAADLMVRNAELERQLATGTDAKTLRAAATLWNKSPQGRIIAESLETLRNTGKRLSGLKKAASYNPKARSSR